MIQQQRISASTAEQFRFQLVETCDNLDKGIINGQRSINSRAPKSLLGKCHNKMLKDIYY